MESEAGVDGEGQRIKYENGESKSLVMFEQAVHATSHAN